MLFPALKAADYQPADDLARQKAETAEPKVADAFETGWTAILAGLDFAALLAALSAGTRVWILQVLGTAEIGERMAPAFQALTALHDDVAAATMAAMRPAAPTSPITPSPLAYDRLAPEAVTDLTAARAELVTQLTTSADGALDAVVAQAMSGRWSMQTLARALRETIGLAPRQAAAVENFRRLLEQGDRAALDRLLRDRRFDASIARAISGQALEPAKIDRMVARYAERMRRHRAHTIARTETLRAANAGRREAWRQRAARRGGEARRFWLTAADERVCPICRAIPLMNPLGVALDEPYASPAGPVKASPQHPVCRCTERFEMAGEAAGNT